MKKVILFAAVISAFLINACGGGSSSSNALYPPALPTDLAVLECDESTVTIQWTDNADNESGYDIERSVNGGDFALVVQTGSDETEFTESLADDTYYTYRVRAFNSAGDSGYSNEESIKRPKSAETEIDNSTGGKVEITGLAAITFPADSISSDETVTMVEGVKGDSVADDKKAYLGIASDIRVVTVVDFTTVDMNVEKNINLVMYYNPDFITQFNAEIQAKNDTLVAQGVLTQDDVNGMKLAVEDLDIYYFNIITSKWVKTDAVIDTTGHTFKLNTPYAGIYCVGYSQSDKTGFSFEANPELQQYMIDMANNPEQYGDEGIEGVSKSGGSCPYSCGGGNTSKSVILKVYDGYHTSCTRCPKQLTVNGEVVTSTHGTLSDPDKDISLGCDNCSAPWDEADENTGYALTGACASHDCCYRHGENTYGFKKFNCDLNFMGEAVYGCAKVHPLIKCRSFKVCGHRFKICYPNPDPHIYYNFVNCGYLAAKAYWNFADKDKYKAECVAYDSQLCFNYYGLNVDCNVPRLHYIAVSENGKTWCEPGQTIDLVSNVYNQDSRDITYLWSASSGSIKGSDGTAVWTAPSSLADDIDVVITCKISDGVHNIPAKTITLKVLIPYTITYNANTADTGSVPELQTHVYYGNAVKLALNTGNLQKKDLYFGGWNTASDGSGLDRPAGSFYIMGKADVTFFVKWIIQAVAYDGNGNTGGDVPIDKYNYQSGDTVTVMGPGSLTRDCYTFMWWNTTYDGDGTTYLPGEKFIFGSSSVTLYAIWSGTQLFGVTGKNTGFKDLSIDANGNKYFTGYTTGTLDGQILTGLCDLFICKYNPAGVRQWTRLVGVSEKVTQGLSITIDSANNIYITGYTNGNLDGQVLSGTWDTFICKYNSEGVRQWTRLIGVSGKDTMARKMDLDSSGNVYITGYTNGNLDGQVLTGTNDAFLIKYDSSGVKQWIQLLGVTGQGTCGEGVDLDSSGNIYITGETNGSLDGQPLSGTCDLFLSKYDSTGAKQWTRQLGASFETTVAYSVAIDSENNICITGYTTGSLDGQPLSGTYDLFLSKYDSTGAKQWTRQLGASEKNTQGFSIAINSENNIYITGMTMGNLDGQVLNGTRDAFICKYNPEGVKQWTELLGVSGRSTLANDICFDSINNIYISGYTNGNLDWQKLTGTQDAFITTIPNH